MTPFLVALQQADPLAGAAPTISGQAMLTATIVVALVGAAAWALRRTNTLRRGRAPIAVETAVPLGERRSLVVVSVEGRRLLLGLTPQNVALLTELHGAPPSAAFVQALDARLSADQPSAQDPQVSRP